MKLKYIMNTEMWVVGAGVFKRGQITDEKDPKKVEKLLKTGMFRKVEPVKKTTTIKLEKLVKPRKIKIKKSKKKGDDK